VVVGFSKFLNGCGDVVAVARVTTIQLLAASLGFCAVLALGGKLWAFPCSQICGLVGPLVWLLLIRRPLLADLWRAVRGNAALSWARDVRPVQWRIAISLICAESYQLMIPGATAFYGADVAGHLGLVLAVTVPIQKLGIAWVETRAPLF